MPRDLRKRKREGHWEDVAEKAQKLRDESIAKVGPPQPPGGELPQRTIDIPRKVLTSEDLRITELPIESIQSELAEGKLTAIRLVGAFLRRAGLAQKLTNCITELLPERALARAKELDEHFARHKRLVGPLHGLPVSVKEHIGMRGLGLNAGYAAWWDRVADADAHVLQILARAGAVFHARTTQPQSLMHLETDSNLYGVTVNPYDRRLSAGGSSGGEGALIALRGSVLGIGSDVGGSVRSPAANNGIYSLRPTAYRIPTDGWSSTAPSPAADTIAAVIGPMSVSLSGIKLFMKAAIDAKPWITEPSLVPVPWNPSLQIDPKVALKIAVLWHDGVVKPHPPITRAMGSFVKELKSVPNVTVVDWKPHLHDEAWAIICSLYYPDGGEEDAAVINASGEPWRPLTTWMLKENPCVKKLDMKKLWYWQEEREEYRKEYAKVWNETATRQDPGTGEPLGMVDAILCPVGPGVAPHHNTAKYWGYTSQWNLLDYPALVFPVSRVDARMDTAEKSYKPMTNVDKENWMLYDPELFDGLPISLQLVGRQFEDEKTIAILEYIQKSIDLSGLG